MGIGIRPDMIVGRSEEPLSDDIRRKISMFCGVPVDAVVSSPNARSIYEVPMILEKHELVSGYDGCGADACAAGDPLDRIGGGVSEQREYRKGRLGHPCASDGS